jgi:hypothetical protein
MANVTLSAPIYRHRKIIISKSEYYISPSEYLEAEKSSEIKHEYKDQEFEYFKT